MRARSKSSTVSDDRFGIEELIAQLGTRLNRVNGSTQRAANGSASEFGDLVNIALESLLARVSGRTNAAASDFAGRASKAGATAFQRVLDEFERYPLATLAVAAGIGFLLGSTRR